MISLNPPIAPRDGDILRVLGIARISTLNQDERSLDDQVALLKTHLTNHYDGPVEWTIIKSQGSGERVDRQELFEAEELIESGQVDLIVTEDLGRIMRRSQAIGFCELCEDCEVRLIAINDHLDTAQDNWRMSAMFATYRHEAYNFDTAKRIKRSLDHRFLQGGIINHILFGYIKPDGATNDNQLCKDMALDAAIQHAGRMLYDGASYCEVADYFNAQGLKPGPCCRSAQWNGAMVARWIRNPILKGVRERGRHMAKRENKSGKHKQIKAPKQNLKQRHCPHLAFFEADFYDELIGLLADRNAKYRVDRPDRRDPRKGRPRAHVPWPAQHVWCDICGWKFVRGGHGIKDKMMCDGARHYECWDAGSFDANLAAERLCAKILEHIMRLPEFGEMYVEDCRRKYEQLQQADQQQIKVLQAREQELERKRDNLINALAATGNSEAVAAMIRNHETELKQVGRDIRKLQKQRPKAPALPSMQRLRDLAQQAFTDVAYDCPEFGRLMHRLIDKVYVYPVILCDGGTVVHRARFTLHLARLLPDAEFDAGLEAMLTVEMQVDLFDPPQRERFRKQAVDLRAQGLTERQIAAELGITQPAVQYAFKLQHKMDKLGLTDAYVPVTNPQQLPSQYRRHLHPRFQSTSGEDTVRA